MVSIFGSWLGWNLSEFLARAAARVHPCGGLDASEAAVNISGCVQPDASVMVGVVVAVDEGGHEPSCVGE
jgi:hypothetical protein